MDIEEKKDRILVAQKYFVKSFWLSFILLILASLLCMVFRDTQIAMMEKYFQVGAKEWGWLVTLVLGIWKVLIIQFTLVPALVLTCMKRCCCKNVCEISQE